MSSRNTIEASMSISPPPWSVCHLLQRLEQHHLFQQMPPQAHFGRLVRRRQDVICHLPSRVKKLAARCAVQLMSTHPIVVIHALSADYFDFIMPLNFSIFLLRAIVFHLVSISNRFIIIIISYLWLATTTGFKKRPKSLNVNQVLTHDHHLLLPCLLQTLRRCINCRLFPHSWLALCVASPASASAWTARSAQCSLGWCWVRCRLPTMLALCPHRPSSFFLMLSVLLAFAHLLQLLLPLANLLLLYPGLRLTRAGILDVRKYLTHQRVKLIARTRAQRSIIGFHLSARQSQFASQVPVISKKWLM